MATTADSNDKKLPNTNQFCPIFSLKSIYSLQPSWWKQNLFVFLLNFLQHLQKFVFNWPDSLMKETQSEKDKLSSSSSSARHQRCISDALINIYECVFDAAFKVPSTQHLTTASLYRTRPSPRSPVLKQSIIKVTQMAFQVGRLKPAIFLCSRHAGKRLLLIWSLVRLYSSSTNSHGAFFLLLFEKAEQNKVLESLYAALMSIWCWNEMKAVNKIKEGGEKRKDGGMKCV